MTVLLTFFLSLFLSEIPPFWSIEITIKSDFSPYLHTILKVEKREKFLVGILSKEIGGSEEDQRELSLLPETLEQTLYGILRELATQNSCEFQKKTSDSIVYSLEIDAGNSVIHKSCLVFPEEYFHKKTSFHQMYSLMKIVREFVEDPPFPNIFVREEEKGYLHVFALPDGKVSIDGIPTGLPLPVYYYPLKAGKHSLTITDEKKSRKRTYYFTILPGTTTILNLLED